MAGKKWLKLTINCAPQLVEPISDFIMGMVEAGVETGAPDEPHFGIIQVYVSQENPSQQEIDDIVTLVSGQLTHLATIFQLETPQLATEMIHEEDWGKSWKEHFKPLPLGDKLVIVPSWEQYQPAPGEKVIVMDPGMAFGTGHHATTALCVELIEEIAEKQELGRVLDVGTGTGILAMAAALAGAIEVKGIDNDPDAVDAAAANIAVNNLAGSVAVDIAPLAMLGGSYDLVVANIISSVLLAMAADLERLLASGGKLILSGILHGAQEAEIAKVFAEHGLVLLESRQQKEWVALLFQKDAQLSTVGEVS